MNQGGDDVANIGKSISIKGDLTGNEDLVVEGKVDGKIDLPSNQLTIGANGTARAEITAKSIVIVGRVTGNVTATERLEIQATGIVEGDVKGVKLCVGNSGAVNGSVTAEMTLVRGRVNGDITSKAVTLTAGARVSGDILHETLIVEAGARLEGHCRRMESVSGGSSSVNLVVNDGKLA